ncbi:MAG: DUF924 domain-containing protein, partial [Gammaproteobacteria bacterium]|nr:DUF924 domain-containing protein [Gammaproteobacteria bacterium]
MGFREILKFWFQETDRKQWWAKDSAFDAVIAGRFGAVHARASQCELYAWRKSPQGRLAEIIILDQFSRNIYRDNPLAFATDSLALALAQEAVSAGADKKLTSAEMAFLYMPFMHSESPVIHQTAVRLYGADG